MDNPHTSLCDKSGANHHSMCDFIFRREKVDYFGYCQVFEYHSDACLILLLFRIIVSMAEGKQSVVLMVKHMKASAMQEEWAWQLIT